MVKALLEIFGPVCSVVGAAWYLRGRLDYQDFMLKSLNERLRRVEKKVDLSND